MSTTPAKSKTTSSPMKNTAKQNGITIRLKRGTICCNPKQRATVRGLGLTRREQVKTLENTPSIRGMIKKVLHLLEIVSES